MGVDGVIPGVAYTLLDSKSASDQLFSVYLVKLLLDSGLNTSVTPQLLTMAQSNLQWSRIMNQSGKFPSSSSSSSSLSTKKSTSTNGGGIGFGSAGSTPQAMTSSMLANRSQTQAVEIESEGVKKAFNKLMGSNNNSNNNIEGEQKKRKSRFSITTNESTSSSSSSAPSSSSSSSPGIPAISATLPGFVRSLNSATSSLHSTTAPSTSQITKSTSKKSRWG